jgi:CheY-like chemotaxis protein
MSGDRQRCLDAGCDEYETKPFLKARFYRTVHRLLDAEQNQSQQAA